MSPAPKVDNRTASDIAAQVRELLPEYVAGWQRDPENRGAGEALVRIFARYCEVLIERLNKTPEKNFLAFLNLLGASPAPAQPARAPLTFYLTAQSRVGAIIPARTQVAALPAKNESEPTVFETEQELVVAPVRLDTLWVRDDARDRYADYRMLLDQTALPPSTGKLDDIAFLDQVTWRLAGGPPLSDQIAAFAADTSTERRQRVVDRIVDGLPAGGVPMFRGNEQFDHFLFIAVEPVSSSPVWKELRVKFELERDVPARANATTDALQWRIWDGGSGVQLKPDADTTQNLTRSGEVVFANVPAPSLVNVNGRAGRWLRASWKPPDQSAANWEQPTADALPVVHTITVILETEQQLQRLERGFLNNLPVDLSKDFYPFGERPRFGDTLYLASPLFSAEGATVTLVVTLTNPASAGNSAPVPAVKPVAPRLQWECWSGAEWRSIGVSEFARVTVEPLVRIRIDRPDTLPEEPAEGGFSDTTQAFVETGKVNFRLPYPGTRYAVGRQDGYWIRVRLVSGDYGRDLRYELETGKGYVVTPPTFAPPVIHTIQVQQELKVQRPPAAVLTYNDFTFKDVTAQPFAPFIMGAESQPSCYLGLQPINGKFPRDEMSFYLNLANPAHIEVDEPGPNRAPVIWEYWNGKAWTPCTLQDDTGGLRHSGLIKLLCPADFASSIELGQERFWLRARNVEATAFDPALRGVFLNTTMASHTQTTLGEVLGSGTGKPNQIFRTARKPILKGQILEVLEPTPPTSTERDRIEREEGPLAIRVMAATQAGRVQAWVRWHEMPNFESSGPRDRHYILNRESGEVRFGDGVSGLVPPALTSGIRMMSYSTGGGVAGNRPARSIVQLRTAISYVERVTNFAVADGGADVETVATVLDRVPRELRHGGRAVTAEDFEDLARLASAEVVRAKCLPLRDLEKDPEGEKRYPGVISLIVAPRWADGMVKPKAPSAEVFARVREFLDARRLRSVKLVLAAPDYIRVNLKAEITVGDVDASSQVELAVTLALGRFLHPFSGFEGNGWAFGRLPSKSNLYTLIENVPGVEHVRSLEIEAVAASADAERIGRFLIYGGDIQIAATLET
jgi:hypothetical protein